METYQLFVFGSLGLLTLAVVLSAIIWKKSLRTMQGTMISMFFGMNVGLTAGVLLGASYQGNLFISTILSMAIGVLAGSLCGLCFGILSVVEGFMAGVMGGMMGAMVGEMIRIDQSFRLIQLFLFLSLSTIFIIAILKTPQNAKVHSKRWLLKPVLVSSFVAIYIIGGNYFGEQKIGFKLNESPHNQANHTDRIKEKIEKEIQIISIQATTMKYSETEIVIEKNRPVKIIFENHDDLDHEFEIKIPFHMNVNGSMHNQETWNNTLHLHAAPKSTETVSFTPTESGVHEFYCKVPGHKESGMLGLFIVN